ncbi:hypothetical protein CB0940_10993 [Cercospora beticola]|uniref:Uncharacterized protein n=1 Tax=Cercospora beticola TaxID=122368 RepID=A0A2G5HDD0_CERBT|nr:hypothetical protein CB0940_10993 [Cercospora beticola]PIA90541.1 hypothetical protein CB0940_10993 [Cercospora beticola]WPB07817.1 hypothetical protein RHO25_012481 [Cercospora beticola]
MDTHAHGVELSAKDIFHRLQTFLSHTTTKLQFHSTGLPMDFNALASQLAGLGPPPPGISNSIHMPNNGMSESFMNLLYRNAQLETELRLVKDQLAQAQQSTQYLLRLLSGSSNLQPAHNMNNGAEPPSDTILPVMRKDSVTEVLEKPKESVPAAPLVNFEGTDSLLDLNAVEAAAGNTEPALQAHIHPRKLKPDSIGLGISQTSSSRSSIAMTTTEEATPSSSFANPSFRQQQQQPGFTIRQSDGTSMFVPTPSMDNPLETPFRSMTSSESLPILGHEHRSLAGKAFVWVEMTSEELTEVIARYAKEHPRHTAEEYRSYFEDVIRPAYHQQERERAQAREARGENGSVAKDIGEPSTNSSQFGGEQEGAAEASSLEGESSGEPIETQTLVDEIPTVVEKVPPEVKDDVCNSELANVASSTSVRFLEEKSSEALLTRAGPRSDEQTPPNGLGAEFDAIGGSLVAKELEFEASGDFAPEPELVLAAANVTPSTTVTSTPSTADYQPPRLYNPAALGDAKILQAEFQNRVPSRGRRHMDRSSRPERHDSKVSNYPGGCDRQGFNNTSYITYPNEIQDLFATAAECDEHPQRSVLVTNIPPSTTLLDVLSTIHSGQIFSSIFLDTSGMRTNPPISTATALLTFVHGRDALDFTKNSIQHPFSVQLLPTVSRPIHPSIGSSTRILSISDPKNIWTPNEVVLRLIANGVPHPLKAESSTETPGLLLFHFASMPEAQVAYHAISRDYAFFGNVEKGYFKDPCDNNKPLPTHRDEDPVQVQDTTTPLNPSQHHSKPQKQQQNVDETDGSEVETSHTLLSVDPVNQSSLLKSHSQLPPPPPPCPAKTIPYSSGIHTKIPYQSIMFEG